MKLLFLGYAAMLGTKVSLTKIYLMRKHM